jgi:hypothetical protein
MTDHPRVIVALERIANAMESKSIPEKAQKEIKALKNQLALSHYSFAAMLEEILNEGAYTMMDRARELRALTVLMRNIAKDFEKND